MYWTISICFFEISVCFSGGIGNRFHFCSGIIPLSFFPLPFPVLTTLNLKKNFKYSKTAPQVSPQSDRPCFTSLLVFWTRLNDFSDCMRSHFRKKRFCSPKIFQSITWIVCTLAESFFFQWRQIMSIKNENGLKKLNPTQTKSKLAQQ